MWFSARTRGFGADKLYQMLNLDPPNHRSLKPACPLCTGTVDRVPRTLLDRVLSHFLPRGQALYRYQCWVPTCAWQGILKRRAGRSNVYGAEGSRRHVLGAARMLDAGK